MSITKIISKITCYFKGHTLGGKDFKTCLRCNKIVSGKPKMDTPIPPPKQNKFTLSSLAVAVE